MSQNPERWPTTIEDPLAEEIDRCGECDGPLDRQGRCELGCDQPEECE